MLQWRNAHTQSYSRYPLTLSDDDLAPDLNKHKASVCDLFAIKMPERLLKLDFTPLKSWHIIVGTYL